MASDVRRRLSACATGDNSGKQRRDLPRRKQYSGKNYTDQSRKKNCVNWRRKSALGVLEGFFCKNDNFPTSGIRFRRRAERVQCGEEEDEQYPEIKLIN
jgi:hypothetical protein